MVLYIYIIFRGKNVRGSEPGYTWNAIKSNCKNTFIKKHNNSIRNTSLQEKMNYIDIRHYQKHDYNVLSMKDEIIHVNI